MGVNTYYEYVNTLADYLNLKQLSFDIYPIYPGRIQNNWHKCLEIMADAAKRHGVPLWTFAASCWINKELPKQTREKPNKMNILLQLYTSLAFGSQLVQYFTIQDYGGTDFAPIMRDGTWTQAYDYLKDANLEMQKRAFVFKGSNVTKVRQEIINANDLLDIWKGRIGEQIVAQELLNLNNDINQTRSFWTKGRGDGGAEVDLTWVVDSQLVPIEVKTGHNSHLRSLHSFMDASPISIAVRVWSGPFSVDDVVTTVGRKPFKLVNLPFYLIGELERIVRENC